MTTTRPSSSFHGNTVDTTRTSDASSSSWVPLIIEGSSTADGNESTLYEVISSSDDNDEFILEEITIASFSKDPTITNHDRASSEETSFDEVTVYSTHDNNDDKDGTPIDKGRFCPNSKNTTTTNGETILNNNQRQHLIHQAITESSVSTDELIYKKGEKLASATILPQQAGTSAPNQQASSSADDDDESFFELALPKLQPQVSGLSCFVDWQNNTGNDVQGTNNTTDAGLIMSPCRRKEEEAEDYKNANQKTVLPAGFRTTTAGTAADALPRTPPPRHHVRPSGTTTSTGTATPTSTTSTRGTISMFSPKEGFELRLHLQREISGLSISGLESIHEEEEEAQEIVQEESTVAQKDEPIDWEPKDDPNDVFAATAAVAEAPAKKKGHFPSFRSPRRTTAEATSPKRLSTIEEGFIHHASSLHRRTSSPSPPRGKKKTKTKKASIVGTIQDMKRSHRQQRRMAVESSLDRFHDEEQQQQHQDEEATITAVPKDNNNNIGGGPSISSARNNGSLSLLSNEESSSIDESSKEEEEEEHGFELVLQPMVRQPSALTFCPFDLQDDDDDVGELEESILPAASKNIIGPKSSSNSSKKSSKKPRKTDKKDKKSSNSRSSKRSSLASNASKPRRQLTTTSSRKIKRSSTVSASAAEGVTRKPSPSVQPKRHSYSSVLPDSSRSSSPSRAMRSKSPSSSFHSRKKGASRSRSKSPSSSKSQNKQSTITSQSRRKSSSSSDKVPRARSRSPKSSSSSRHRRRHSAIPSLSPPPPPPGSKRKGAKKGTIGTISTTKEDPAKSKTTVIPPSQPSRRNQTRQSFPTARRSNPRELSLSDHNPVARKRKTAWKKSSRRKSDNTSTSKTDDAPRCKRAGSDTDGYDIQNDQTLANLPEGVEILVANETKKSIQKNLGESNLNKKVESNNNKIKNKNSSCATIPKRASYPSAIVRVSSRDMAGWRKVVPRRSANV